MIDKDYCLSSFLAFRFVVDSNITFAEGIDRQKYTRIPDNARTLVADSEDTDIAIKNVFRLISNEKIGLLLSGGMDSAVLASYLPKGSDAYTFRFLNGKYQKEELNRAEQYAKYYNLNLHYVDIDWDIVKNSINIVMQHKGAPVHSIEPQLFYAAQQAKKDGITMLVIGDGADYVFGGMDGILSQDYSYSQFVKRMSYIDPRDVLVTPFDINKIFEEYRIGPNSIDYIRFYNEIFTDESYSSYENAFLSAEMPYIDPYDHLKLSKPLDLGRIRNGESKYIIRELFKIKYPDYSIPPKLPMPRLVDKYLSDWSGPTRKEFRSGIDMTKLSGNQKWLLWISEQFLNRIDKWE